MIFGKYINPYYKKYWYLFLAVFTIDAVVDILQLLIPLIIGNVVSVFSVDPNTLSSTLNTNPLRVFQGFTHRFTFHAEEGLPFYETDFFLVLLSIAVIGFLIFLGRMGWRYFSAKIGANIEADLRKKMFQHIQTLSLSYYNSKKVGGLLSYFTNDLSTIKSCFTEGLIFSTDLIVLGSLSFTLMMLLSYKVTLLTAIPLLAFSVFGGVIGKGESNRFKISDDAFEHLSDFTEENLQGFNVIKSFRKEKDRIRSFSSLAEEAKVTSIRYLRFSSLIDSGINVFLSITYAVLYFLAAYVILKQDSSFGGQLTDIGKLTTYVGYYGSLIWPMIAGGLLIDYSSRAYGARKRIANILDAKPDIQDEDNAPKNELKGEIEFRDLSFTYPDGTLPALHHITFQVKPGMRVGIIGKTGSGKTTLVSLIPKLYNLKKGSLYLDGVDIMDWRKEDIRKHLGYVLQEGFLFSGTIKDNIAFSEDQPGVLDREKVRKAAQFADIEDDILLFPKGYDTVVGEKGATLSGGQRQRVSIARAIYKDPSVLILDDSLSAVDADTEKEILNHLSTQEKKVTTFLITHRVSTLEDCDLILVMDKGSIIAQGKHQELYDSCPLYHNICELQKLQKEVD